MKKTFKELNELDNLVGELYLKNPTLQQSKFGYAYKRFVQKNLQKPFEEFQTKINDVRIDNALVDEKTKEVLIDRTNVRGFKFGKEGLKQVIQEEQKLREEWDKKEIEIEPYISPFIPENLTEEQKEALTGLII